MSFQLKTRDQPENNIDAQTKQKIIDQLKSEVEFLKAKYILDEKSKTSTDKNQTAYQAINKNILMNTKQSDEFSKTLPKKTEKNNINYDFRNFSNNDENDEFNFVERDDNYLEKNDSVIINDNNEGNLYENFANANADKNNFNANYNSNVNFNLNYEQEEKEIGNPYPKEYKKGNLNLNNLNYNADKNNFINSNINNNHYGNNIFSQSLKDKDLENLAKNNNYLNQSDKRLSNSYKNNNNKIIDYDMFDKAKENLLKIRNDLDELDKYDVNKNRRIYDMLGKQPNTQQNSQIQNQDELLEERPKNFEEEISIHSKSIRDDSQQINLINSNEKNRLCNNLEYNFHEMNSPHNNNNVFNNSQLDKNHQQQKEMQMHNYPSYKQNENVGYNYDPNAFNNPANIYKKPSMNSRIGNTSNMGEEDYIQSNIKSFNNKIQNNLQNMNYSNISNREFQNANYSGDEMGNYEVLEHQHENYHNRSPDSLLRYNNSNSQSPENQSGFRNNQNNSNAYTNIQTHQGRERERSPPDNTNDPYFKKMKGKYDPKYKKEKSKEKFEKLKEEMQQKFQLEHTFKPRINYNFSAVKDKSRESKNEIYKRLSTPKVLEINKRLREKEQIDNLKMKEECPFKPKISNKNELFDESEEKNAKPDKITARLYKLAEQMKEKREKLKREHQDSEVGNYSFAPNIDEYSKKLVMKYQNKPIHERYNEILTAKNQNLYLLRMNTEKAERSLYKPEINQKSKHITSNNQNLDKSVEMSPHERLYREGLKKMRGRSENPATELEECTFSPQLCYSTTQANGNIDDFLERQKIYEEIRKDRLDRKMSKSIEHNQYTFKPKINLTSEFLVRSDTNRINEKSGEKYERLCNQNYEKILKKKIQLEEFYYSQYDFKPKINETSRYIGRDHSLTDLAVKKATGKSKDYRSNHAKEQAQECTFKPKTNKNKFENVHSNYKVDEKILDRINDELKSKNEKVDGLKNYIEERDLKECKFRPQINKDMPAYDSKEPLVLKGFARHMEQMEKARKAKRDKELREKEVFITGENWSRDNLITVPKPFNLSYQKLNHGKKKEDIVKRNKEEELKECTFKPNTNESKNKEIIKMILRE